MYTRNRMRLLHESCLQPVKIFQELKEWRFKCELSKCCENRKQTKTHRIHWEPRTIRSAKKAEWSSKNFYWRTNASERWDDQLPDPEKVSKAWFHSPCFHSLSIPQGTRLDSSKHQILPDNTRSEQGKEAGVRTESYRHWRYIPQRGLQWWMLNFPATVPRHLLSKNRRTSENEAQTKHPLKVHVWAGISRHCAKTGKNKRTAPLGATISNKSHDQRSAAHLNFTILLNTRAVCTWREVRTFELHTCGCFLLCFIQ